MVLFYRIKTGAYYLVDVAEKLLADDLDKLHWLFGNAEIINQSVLEGLFVGPRKEMITPWSTNAVEITRNMGIQGIKRIEEFVPVQSEDTEYDPMLKALYKSLDQKVFTIDIEPEEVIYIEDIARYNQKEGLALSDDEVEYLEEISHKLNRKLTDSEVFGFSQVNSEHCRHKIFNGTFIIDGEEKKDSLFALIKKTSKDHPNRIVSAYKDNVAFVVGPRIEQFAPKTQDKPDYFEVKDIDTVISLKAETHNFPTTVEPFNGAATGTGGEIRDRMGGGKGSIPLIGTAVYMTAYPRLEDNRKWEQAVKERKWLYQTPSEILIKASNGASDFGNKFGQPLLCGSLFTFEHEEDEKQQAFDKVIMLAGGVGFARKEDSIKDIPEAGDVIVMLGGDNYRIGMGGGAVSSVATGEYSQALELNAVQRSNPEMQKRVCNAIRAMAELGINPIVSIHDHGAGGHLNSFSELVEETGGNIDIRKLPIGDPTLSAKEIIGNESQERMGLIIKEKDFETLERVAKRERAPIYNVGKTTGDDVFRFVDEQAKQNPIDIDLEYLFGKPPKTILNDKNLNVNYKDLEYQAEKFQEYLENVLQIEAVACKDWLTNKVDRSVTGRSALQQCAGEIQLPLNDCAVVAMDYQGEKGIATSLGHAPVPSLIDPEKGSRLAVAESLSNIVWAPLVDGIKSISLSANWMWPAKNPGEDARLYKAVEGLSAFASALGINVPTGKDSLSMTQKYPDGKKVYAPGTVIVSAAGEVTDITNIPGPVLKDVKGSKLVYIDLSKDGFHLGGSSFAQVINRIGTDSPNVNDPEYFAKAFNLVQELINEKKILAGHDVSAGGLITAALEMCFANTTGGLNLSLNDIPERDSMKVLFSEKPALLIQCDDFEYISRKLKSGNIHFHVLGEISEERTLNIEHHSFKASLDIDEMRDVWYKTSYLFDRLQAGEEHAKERYANYKKQNLQFDFPKHFTGLGKDLGIDVRRREKTGIKAAIIREKGVNGDREMANVMHKAGFDVKDVHMTDLIEGRETLEDIHFIVYVGGFSNSDVLGSGKGWAGAFLYNEKAKTALENFYKREDTLSLGVCNGCQVIMELEMVYPERKEHPKMLVNTSGKFESAFINLDIPENHSVMFSSLANSRLGAWVAHAEGYFGLPETPDSYHIAARYSYNEYPANPNGSPDAIAALCSEDGRHLAIMPHLERAYLPWQWPIYPEGREHDEITPWVEAFVNARNWIVEKKS